MHSSPPASPVRPSVQGLEETRALKLCDFPCKGGKGAAIATETTKGGRRAPEPGWTQGGGGRESAPPHPGTSRPAGRVVRPLAGWDPRASPIGRAP